MGGFCWRLGLWCPLRLRLAWWSGFCSGSAAMVLWFLRYTGLSWARCFWRLAPSSSELDSEVGMKKSFGLCLVVGVSLLAQAAAVTQTATLRDLQTVGSTTKKQ